MLFDVTKHKIIMKKTKSLILTFAVILGGLGAMAFKPVESAKKPFDHIFYAVSTDGINFSWVTSPPAGYSCQAATGTCEISTPQSGTPAPDTYPSSYTDLQGTDFRSALMPN